MDGLGGHPYMTSAKFSGIWTPPPCPHLGLIYSTKFMQPPLLHLIWANPPPLSADVVYGCPLVLVLYKAVEASAEAVDR